ncbi:MAG: roadblock/LC7 domain-containing protein [Deltaproteobacteria bacterium]|nr:roadblock/LC7 domain-containing protein [Deltaproteobacteria bacterium]
MGFPEILKEMVDNAKGGMAATIMAKDGMAIQNYVKDKSDYDVDSLGVEYARILEETKNACSMLKLGEVEELSVSAEDSTIITRLINKDYFIAIVLDSGGNFGKARYYLKKAAAGARKEF